MGRIIMKVRKNIGILQNYHKNANGIYVNEYLWYLPNGYNSARFEMPNDGQFGEDYIAMAGMIDFYTERIGFTDSQKMFEKLLKNAKR